MKVLITGGAGYVGSVTTQALLRAGHEVRVLDALFHGGQGIVWALGDERCELIHGDLRSRPVVEAALRGADAVVHLAAVVGDPACALEPELARAVNLDASLQLFDLARRAGVARGVFISTCSNYGRMADSDEPLTEEAPLRPLSLYATTKVEVERELLDPTTPGQGVLSVLRLSTVYGLSPRMRFDLTVNDFVLQLATGQTLEVFGERFWRPYVHVADVARAILTVLEAPRSAVDREVFNVGDTGQNWRKGTLAELIRARIGGDGRIRYVPRDNDPRDYRVSSDKIRDVLGFRITRTIEDGIDEVRRAVAAGMFHDPAGPLYRNTST